MPIHDWTRVRAGTFHHFHLQWICALSDALNTGGLPSDYYAMMERIARGPLPQVEEDIYARKANRIAIRHEDGRIVAVIEIVSRGNKDSRNALRSFVDKAVELINEGVHLLIVDLYPPGKRDPQGIHKAIWDEIHEEDFELPPDKPLTLAAYWARTVKTAYVEPVVVGDCLPDMPLFLEPDFWVPTPLEATYQTSWSVFPAALKGQLEGPRATI